MDLGFFQRAEQMFAGRHDVALDYGLLVAMLRSHQLGTPTACADSMRFARPTMGEPLVELLLGGTHWRHAAAQQGGSFNPAYARKGGVN